MSMLRVMLSSVRRSFYTTSMTTRTVLAGLLLSLPFSGASAICPVDDFDDANDDGWIQCGEWNERQRPNWDASSGRYCLGLSEPLREPPPPPLSIAAEWTQAGSDPRYHNGCALVDFRSGSEREGTWSTHFVLGLRADCKNGGYKAMMGPSLGRVSIFRRLEILADSVTVAFAEDTDYHAEFCAVGAQLSLTVWPRGEPRPPVATLTATNDRYTSGNIGLGVFIENDNRGPNVQGCFDNVRFRPANGCRADLDCDGTVGASDLRTLLGRWGGVEHCDGTADADIDGDCLVGFGDARELLGAWGDCADTVDP